MESIWQIWLMIFETFPIMLTDVRYLLIISLVFFLIHGQYRRVHKLGQKMFGLSRGSALKDTFISLLFGIVGGLLATIFFLIIGISLSDTGIAYIWLTAIFLMIIHPRFLCFSYAGGLVSLFYLIFGVPEVDVSAIMALVAVLHLVEALLIWVDGHSKPTPIFLKNQNGKVVGGFSMQKFWPLPFVALLGVVVLNSGIDFDTISMPDWWPLLHPDTYVPSGHSMVYMMFPVMAALGYSDIAVTSLPKEKVVQSARYLLGFSIVLLGLALLANYSVVLAFIAALFAPLAHEWLIYQGQVNEQKRPPIFTQQDGVMILDVYPNSPAEKIGLQTGDIIISVNGIPVKSVYDLVTEMTPWLIDPVFKVENDLKNLPIRDVHFRGKVPPIGIIPTPDPHQKVYIEMKDGLLKSYFKRLWKNRKG